MDNYTLYMHILPKEISGYKNDKYYIGITQMKPEYRWNGGRGYKKQFFGKAIRKYGWENFEHIIIDTGLSKEQAKDKEMFFIEKYKSCDRRYGYNVTTGGDNVMPREILDERNRKISLARKGQKLSETTKMKIAEMHKGKKLTPEHIEKIVESRKKYYKKTKCVETQVEYKSIKEASSMTGISHLAIARSCKGKNIRCGLHFVHC